MVLKVLPPSNCNNRNNRAICLIISLLILMCGCTGKYFREAAQPLPHVVYSDASDLPYSEYWTGIVFNGSKIGFSHQKILPSQETAGRFDVHSGAALRIRFLMFDKHINMQSHDQVAADLSIQQF